MRSLSLLLLLGVAVHAQIRVSVEAPAGFQPLPSFYSLGVTNPGEPLDVRLRVKNEGGVSVTLPTVEASGAGFSVLDIPVPLSLAPGAEVSLRVRFLPPEEGSYSASLLAGGSAYLLYATARAGVSLACEEDGNLAPIPSGGVIDFGPALVFRTVERRCRLQNRLNTPLTVGRVEADRAFVDGPVLPVQLAPGQEVLLRISMTAPAPGSAIGSLRVDGRTFLLRLTGVVPLPSGTILPEHETLVSGEQVKIRLAVAAAGTLQLEFYPDGGHPDDPAVRFPGGRSARFTVPAGDAAARFGTSDFIVLQTGTLSGRILLRVTTAQGEAMREFRTAPARVVLDQAEAARVGDTLVLSFAGFDNTRSSPSVRFRFADRAGNALGEPLLIQPEREWRSYYASGAMGGMFSVKAVFPVWGDASLVGSVTVEFANGVGQTSTSRLPIR